MPLNVIDNIHQFLTGNVTEAEIREIEETKIDVMMNLSGNIRLGTKLTREIKILSCNINLFRTHEKKLYHLFMDTIQDNIFLTKLEKK